MTYVFKDAAGNSSTCYFKVTVVDDTKPVISGCPLPITVLSSAANPLSCSQTATWTEPTASDNCDGAVAYFTRSHAPGATFPKGETTVTYVFKDAAGNTSTCYFKVTVVDDTKPTATQGSINACYQTVAAANAAALAATTALTDNCDPLNAGYTITKTVQTSAVVGCSSSVVIRVKDPSGNFTDYSYPVRVDDTAPTFTCPADIEVSVNPTTCTANVPITPPVVSDDCGGTLTAVGVRSDGKPLTDPFPLCITTITWTATDCAGNVLVCCQKVRVKADVTLTYTGDLFAFSSGPTVTTAPVLLAAHLAGAYPTCNPITVTFKILTPTLSTYGTYTALLNSSGDAALLVNNVPVLGFNGQYIVETSINVCWAKGITNDCDALTVDLGSTERRVTGGGWVPHALSANGKANHGFTVGFNKNGTLKGNSLYMIRGTDGFDYQVKNNSWQGGYLNFYKSATGQDDRARFSGKCNIKKINRATGLEVPSGLGGGLTFVVDIFDGDTYNPAQKDKYGIKIFLDSNNTVVWWGSTSAVMDPLAGGGPGGGNNVIFAK